MTDMGRIGDIALIHRGQECDVEWKMDFPSLSKQDGASYVSPEFSFEGERWEFVMFPNGWKYWNLDVTIHLRLWRKFFNGDPITVEFTFSIKTANGEKVLQSLRIENFKGHSYHDNKQFISTSDFEERQSEFLVSRFLTLVCTLKRITSTRSSSGGAGCSNSKRYLDSETISPHKKKCMNKPIKCPHCSVLIDLSSLHDSQMESVKGTDYLSESSKVLEDFKELFLQQKECDVIIRVKDQEFSAHRAILIARSSVFESTFRNGMKEKATGIITIEDCDPSSFSEFLHFLYCGNSENISEENVFSLFVTADKHEVNDLKAKCIEFIKKSLSVDMFCDAITLALKYSENDLIQLATDFFAKNLQQIIMTVKWQSFLAENPTQSNKLLIKALVTDKNSDSFKKCCISNSMDDYEDRLLDYSEESDDENGDKDFLT